MTRAEVSIEKLEAGRHELEEAATVATRAFHFDPFFEFLSPRPILRDRGLAIYWRSVLTSLGDGLRLYGARRPDGRLVGVGAWVGPGDYPPSPWSQVRGSIGGLRALAPRPPAVRDGLKYLLALDKAHPKEELFYLTLLVVDPSVQRLGIGAALQEPVLEEADEQGAGCYLETQNEDNLPYYRRFGYDVAQELHPVRRGPPLWTMRRPAGVAHPG